MNSFILLRPLHMHRRVSCFYQFIMKKFVGTPGHRDHVFACNATMYNNKKVFQYTLPEITKGQSLEDIMEGYVLWYLESY